MRIVPALKRRLGGLARLASREGLRVYAVGGCVRDAMLGRPTRDLDMAVEGDPRVLAQAAVLSWGGASEVFDRFGTVRLNLPGGFRMDFARARAESYPKPAALPVVRPATLAEDLVRRDFTVNAMARPLRARGFGALIDPHGGADDLKARRLKVLHPNSFRDDPTRLFRAARYAGRFALRLEPKTAALLREAVREGLPGLLSRERVRQELIRDLEEDDPDAGMRLLKSWGLWPAFHPRFRWPFRARGLGDALTRLGLCALAMRGGDGAEMIRSLPLERAGAQSLLTALKIAKLRASPRGELDALASRVLRLHFGRLPRAALRPVLLGGDDLDRLGLEPGPAYSRWLERVARAQWRGKFTTHAGALRWLRGVRC
ncbi:MAG: hypothetical protein ABII00_05690 [Elusimicrobiota bacterium]